MSESREQRALDRFGEFLISRVRNEAIEQWNSILDGEMKGVTAEALRPQLSRLEPGDRNFVRGLIPKIVDTTLHHLLWSLEQTKTVSISVRVDDHLVPDLKEVSDGLAGDLYDWIEQFGGEAGSPR